jgi:hypothetical protein
MASLDSTLLVPYKDPNLSSFWKQVVGHMAVNVSLLKAQLYAGNVALLVESTEIHLTFLFPFKFRQIASAPKCVQKYKAR